MELSKKQKLLLEFVKEQHGDQKRKYTNEPYWTHPYAVAVIVSKYVTKAIELALCHDLFEDTNCDFPKLHGFLCKIGYSNIVALETCYQVGDLTDKYTKESYPTWNRLKRKHHEAIRLGITKHIVQNVKYADLIDNTSSIVKHDKKFAKIYLQEKVNILDKMRNGNINLLIDCCYTLKQAINEIGD